MATAEPTRSIEFVDALEREWTDISSETQRVYVFEGGTRMVIDQPLRLHVSDSGGHRVFSGEGGGKSYYVPPRWIAIEWQTAPGRPHFVR